MRKGKSLHMTVHHMVSATQVTAHWQVLKPAEMSYLWNWNWPSQDSTAQGGHHYPRGMYPLLTWLRHGTRAAVGRAQNFDISG